MLILLQKILILMKIGFGKFDVYYNNKFLENIELSVAGNHNILNALACIALCTDYGININVVFTIVKDYNFLLGIIKCQ